MRGGNTRSYPSFPDIEEQVGYNPARFLDTPAPNDMNDLSPLATVEAFIRGMNDVETIRAWQTVEVALGQGPNGTPRQEVIKWLNQRKAALEATAPATESPPDNTVEPTAAEPTATDVSEEVAPSPQADQTATIAATLAADGGTSTDETQPCPVCHGDLTREEIAGQIGYWCPNCGGFREPATEEQA